MPPSTNAAFGAVQKCALVSLVCGQQNIGIQESVLIMRRVTANLDPLTKKRGGREKLLIPRTKMAATRGAGAILSQDPATLALCNQYFSRCQVKNALEAAFHHFFRHTLADETLKCYQSSEAHALETELLLHL